MSGQFPQHEAGGVPVTMNSFSGWNQPPNQPPHGRGVPPGTPPSVVHGMMPHPHMQSSNQVPGSPNAMKFSNVAYNGAGGHLQNSPTASSNSLRNNFQIYVNPHQKCSNASPVPLGGSVDLSCSPRTTGKDDSKPVSSVSQQLNISANLASQNHSAITSITLSGSYNGDVHSSPTSAVSVIANVSTSPGKKEATVTSQTSSFKREPQSSSEFAHTPDKDTSKSSSILEPPLKKLKEEEKCVDSTVIVDTKGSTLSGVKIQEQKDSLVSSSSQSSAPVLSSKQDVMDVESQLEALFAGIADDGSSSKDLKPLSGQASTNLQGTPNVAAVLESKGSASKKGKGKTNGVVKTNEVCGMSSTESTPKKKRKKKPSKPWEDNKNKKGKKGSTSKGKYVKEASCDSGSNTSSSRARGPVVHIEGTKEAPTSLTVVNAPSRQDDEDNDSKKKAVISSRARKILKIEGKLSSSGLCGNSLVTRYEAHSSDPRWVCVFCKKGCHMEGLGDLFGPYLVNHDTELENSLDLDADMDRKNSDKKDKKNKRSGIGQTGVLGLLAIPPLAGEQPQFMVYFHEYCAVWTPSINLIGSRLSGVQEAVWVAVRSKCSRCHLDGANIGCIQHGCSFQVHYPCARDGGWNLDEDTFISTCHIHKKIDQPSILPAASIL